jgi:hydrogenase expression/formation protein HypC
MCIGVPMKVARIDGLVAVAQTEGAGGVVEQHSLDMLLVGPQPPGTWVLAFCGAARRVLDEDEARQILAALAALGIALDAGDGPPPGQAIDALFADLVERTPQLPEHLRPPMTEEPSR